MAALLGERDDESNQDEITSLGTTGTKCVRHGWSAPMTNSW